MPALAQQLIHDLAARFPARADAFQLLVAADCAGHDSQGLTPETPQRLHACLRGLLSLPDHARAAVATPPPAHWRDLGGVHDRGYLQALESAILSRRPQFMARDCPLEDDSEEAILGAAGLALALGDLLAQGGAGLALTRPPGHHAGPKKAEGFCYLSLAALTAHRLRQAHPGAKVCVVDIDVHHGNGTQDCLAQVPATFFLSLHGEPQALYPHRGFVEENKDAPCIVRNFPLPEGTGGGLWQKALREGLREADAFAPDFVLVSLGLDAHQEDPFAFFTLQDADFASALRDLRLLAHRHAQGRLGLLLEGGYSLAMLERVLPQCVLAAMG